MRRKKLISLLLVILTLLLSSSPIFAEVTDRIKVGQDENDLYMYSLSELRQSYRDIVLGKEGQLYNHYSEKGKVVALYDDVRNEFVDYEDIRAAYRRSILEPEYIFIFKEYVENSAEIYEMPGVIKRVFLNENNQVIEEEITIGGPQEPSVTVTFTDDSLLNDGFALGNITANVRGVTGASKYAVRYTVSNASETKPVTTSKVNNGQTTTDLVQYKDGTVIDILVYDVKDSQIHEFLEVEVK